MIGEQRAVPANNHENHGKIDREMVKNGFSVCLSLTHVNPVEFVVKRAPDILWTIAVGIAVILKCVKRKLKGYVRIKDFGTWMIIRRLVTGECNHGWIVIDVN